MGQYAAGTGVSVDRSLDELRRTLRRFGAQQFAFSEEDDRTMVAFRKDGRLVRFSVSMPNPDDPAFTRTETGRVRKPSAAREAWEQACRARWRSLALLVKAKLAAIEDGIETFEQAFFAQLVLPGGQTVFEQVGEAALASIDGGGDAPLELE